MTDTPAGDAAAIVLAAGRGTRMGGDDPKVLAPLNGEPMLLRVLRVLRALGFGPSNPPVVVVGYKGDLVREVVGAVGMCVEQSQQLGTGDAARCGLRALAAETADVLLVHGDEPLIDETTYREMIATRKRTKATIVLLTGRVRDTHNLGRVIRDSRGAIEGLVQQSELNESQRDIDEINFGAYVFDRHWMEAALDQMQVHAGGEYYLTDLIGIAHRQGLSVESVSIADADERMGVNDLEQLRRAETFLRGQSSLSVAAADGG